MIPNMNAGMLIGGRSVGVITIVNSTTANYGTGANPSINVPSGVQSNDLLVAFWHSNASTGNLWTPPSGWTELIDTSPLCVAYKVASGSEPASYTFTHQSNAFAGVMVALRSAALDVTGTVATSLTATSITLAKSNSLLLGFFGAQALSGTSLTTPSGMTSVALSVPSSNGVTSGLFSQYPMSAGATGTRTSTGGFGTYGSILVGIKPK